MYVGECSIEYVVDGKRYSVWAKSGYLDPDPQFVSDRMDKCPATEFAVYYNPKDPSDAQVERLDGPP